MGCVVPIARQCLDSCEEPAGILFQAHRNYWYAPSHGKSNFLVRPITLMKILCYKSGKCLHAMKSVFDFVLPRLSWLDARVSNKGRDAIHFQPLLEPNNLLAHFGFVTQK